MIDKFFKQTNDTIWHFLNEIGKSKEVFSCYSVLEIYDFTLFFYSTHNEIVLVLLDIVKDGTVEYADKGLSLEKRFHEVQPDGEIGHNYHGEWRYSPMAELFYHAKTMRKFYARSGLFKDIPAIHLMLLTNSHIANYSKVIKSWQQDLFGISVLHDLSGLKPGIIYDSRAMGRPFITVNEDLSIEWSNYWTTWQKYEEDRGWFDWNNSLFDDILPPTRRSKSWIIARLSTR